MWNPSRRCWPSLYAEVKFNDKLNPAFLAGYLCRSEAEYAEAITEVLGMDGGARRQLAAAARASSQRFSDAAFKAAFLDAMRPALPRLR